jgi:hypothetical protein
MEVEGGGVGGGEDVVELEDAVKLLVEHLVQPALPRGTIRREEALKPENQETVACQVRRNFCSALLPFVGSDAVGGGVLREGERLGDRAWIVVFSPCDSFSFRGAACLEHSEFAGSTH